VHVRQQQIARSFVLLIILAGWSASLLIPGVEIGQPWIILPILAVFAVVLLGWPVISVPRRGYAVRDKDIVYRYGVLFRNVTAIPYNRVQHVETASGPLDRQFGTATLQLYTAGGSGGDLKIEGLDADIAERLRVRILEKAGAAIEHD